MGRLHNAERIAANISDEFEQALLGVDPARAYEIAGGALAEGFDLATVYGEVIAPALWKVGELWEDGQISVADEHLATAMTYRIMVGLYASTVGSGTDGGHVVLAGVEGEQHVVGLRMAADVLEVAGYETTYLGADVPSEDLLRTLERTNPDLLAISATMPSSAGPLRRLVAKVREVKPGLGMVIGGQGAGLGEDEERTIFASDLHELLEAAKRLVPAKRVEEQQSAPAGFREMLLPFGVALEDEGALTRYLSGITADTADFARALARQASTKEKEDSNALLVIEAKDRDPVQVSSAIAAAVRPWDFVARLGGDRFAVLLPGSDTERAQSLADSLREAIVALDSAQPATPRITVRMAGDNLSKALLQAGNAL